MEPTFIKVSKDELYKPPSGIVIRCGVIPMTNISDKSYLLLGTSEHRVYTDMGGGCKSSRAERPIDCLRREIEEETDSETASIIIKALESDRLCVWRQTARSFEQLGYPFPQRKPGPIHRYYVIIYVDDTTFRLGGPTGKKEVLCYKWYCLDEIAKFRTKDMNQALVDFFIEQDWLSR